MTAARKRNREATEQALLDACGRLLLRDGADGIGVNNVVADAGVGKDLIYRYFGGLPGLIQAWVEREANWPSTEELIGEDPEAFRGLPVNERLKVVWRGFVDALRKRPVIMRILASELMQPTEITSILEQASDRIGRSLDTIMMDLDEAEREDVINVSFIYYSMLTHLCMRAVTNPKYFGRDFDDEASWDYVYRMIDELADRYLHEQFLKQGKSA